ncbi:ferredoxin [Nocardioides sp.]|uniref:ferredoxin n=1 Tax=Nocardioides sp. TaxID=35761 RepID=UPI00272621C6|nr:ferredoxin [Nocardioides sp.]MDO9454752.1 ferredoxin [Nocardioides sp.]
MTGPARLHLDWTRCDGHGSCAELLPELLVADEWGYPVARAGERDPVVPAGLEARARHAARSCPLMALRLLPPARGRPAPPERTAPLSSPAPR